MVLTFVGFAQLLIGLLIVIVGSLRGAFLFLILSGLFSGSAALVAPALGGASVPPVQFALLFVLLRIAVPRGGYVGALPEAFRANFWLVLFTVYGVVCAYVGPRIFAGDLNVFPMRYAEARSLFDTVPLGPTSQNVTATIYLLGALLMTLVTWITCRYRGGAQTLVQGGIIFAWVHALTGIVGILIRGTPLEIAFDVFRNGTYQQLDHTYEGFVRIKGLAPEASTYASIAFSWFVFNAELWYRSIRPRATGRAAILLAVILFFSTSSTAYVGLGCYVFFFCMRAMFLPQAAHGQKIVQAVTAAFCVMVAAAIILAVVPRLPNAIYEMIMHMTLDKRDSASGQQRLFWAMQGFDAFLVSYGLGVGPGSFRSSSLITAIIGTSGVIGILTFCMYLMAVIQPWRKSTWGDGASVGESVGGAMSSAALLTLIPAAISAPNAHPGTTFAMFAGAALALRPYFRKKETVTRVELGRAKDTELNLRGQTHVFPINIRSSENGLAKPSGDPA